MARGFKTGGRTKGTPNRVTSQTREALQVLVHSLIQDLTERTQEKEWFEGLSSLSKEEKVNLLPKLLPFVLPRIQEAEQVQEDTLTL